jgi:hypothetical protein
MKNIFKHISSILYGNTALLVLVVFTIFIIPLFPFAIQKRLFSFSYTGIFFLTIFALEGGRRKMLIFAIVAVVAEWITEFGDLIYLHFISVTIRIVFFSIAIFRMIIQITKTAKIDRNTILEAVNGYLMLGILFALLVAYVVYISPEAFGMELRVDYGGAKFMYFTFVTMSTLGYGEIVPATSAARSLSTLISVTGQIYIAVILALLVGKFASMQKVTEE